MLQYLELEQLVRSELKPGEELRWTGSPDPKRMMIPSIFGFGFGVVWTAFNVNFIWMWHSGPRDVNGPAGLFGFHGILSELSFVPFILIGLAALLSPVWMYRKAKRTIDNIERKERSDGSGDLTFARAASGIVTANSSTRASRLWVFPMFEQSRNCCGN